MSNEQSFEDRFASLEEASRNLSLDVNSLNQTLQIVSALQVEQRAQRERQDAAEAQRAQAQAESESRDMRTRRTIGGGALLMAILLPVVSILVYASLIQHVNDLLNSQKAGFYISCTVRNQATHDNQTRELALANAEKDKTVQEIHRASAASLGKSLVDCSKYLSKKN